MKKPKPRYQTTGLPMLPRTLTDQLTEAAKQANCPVPELLRKLLVMWDEWQEQAGRMID